LRDLIHRWRQAEPKALHLAAAKRLDLLQLLARLDAFGGGRDAEVLGETRDGEHDGNRSAADRRATDEAAVDLDLVEGKAAQMAQATSSVPPARPEEENQIGVAAVDAAPAGFSP